MLGQVYHEADEAADALGSGVEIKLVRRKKMEQHGLLQKDLVDVFGTRSIVSEALSGKRELNKEQIARLSARFHVSPELFF